MIDIAELGRDALVPSTIGIVLALLLSCGQNSKPAASPGNSMPQTPDVCSSVLPYARATREITFLPQFGKNETVLLRPSVDRKRLDDGSAAVAAADSRIGVADAKAQEMSTIAHAGLESLRGMFVALEQGNDKAYLEESAKYASFHSRLSTVVKTLPASCSDEFRPHGRLPPAEIQRNIRTHYDELRRCYEQGLARNAELHGRVTVRFVIGRDGRVQEAHAVNENTLSEQVPDHGTESFFASLGFALPETAAATSLPDNDAIECMVQRYRTMTFPRPYGGIVTVVYPVQFEPTKD